MALYRCGGGGMSETVLWTNPSPSADFVNPDITLSQSMDDFDYIRIEYKYSKSESTANGEVTYPKSIMATAGASSTATPCIVSNDAQSNTYGRPLRRDSSTNIHWYYSSRLAGSSRDNAMNIPTRIVGLK